ncbi:SDR family NAD(P)-dependent oxidoreductase [Pseudooceanicola sp.]|uniref:SDR family NAD(P)-dependent oxidoreductase n=1 Tax=Pseudooceanicola sp. TaxID=1914328 RepID=UPI00351265B4
MAVIDSPLKFPPGTDRLFSVRQLSAYRNHYGSTWINATTKIVIVCKESVTQPKRRAPFMILDLAEPGASASVLAQLDGMDVGPLDILVNNAGIGGSRPLLDSDDAHLLRLIEVNLRAVISLTRDLSPRLRRPGGRVVNVSSIFGMIGNAGTIGYGVAKAGIAQFSRQLATELGPTGITVNAIAPGVVATEMTQEHLKSSRYRQLQVAPIPLGRISQPHEQAAVIAFLASDEASFVSGAVLPVDGGFLATRHAPFSTE